MKLNRLAFLLIPAGLLAHEPGTISGRVTDPSGRPIEGAMVSLHGAGQGTASTSTTDSQGTFRVSGLPKGRYQLAVKHPAYFTLTRSVTLAETHAIQLDLVLHVYSAEVTVEGKAQIVNVSELDEPVNHLLGIADAASQGVVTPAQLDRRPYQRTGEVLETVPGLLISQHSGEGKANQYYLRGFNLDHGTDLSSWVAGTPVNMPTHAHGQGYSDLNFLIPELVRSIQYRKGPYFAEDGDFSGAGAVRMNYVHSLDRPIALLESGSDGYRRALLAGSTKVQGGDLLGAFETLRNDGPWDSPDAYRKTNAVLGYAWAGPTDRFEVTAMAYQGRWNSTDQIPQRAVDQGLIGPYGAIDPTDGGESRRSSISGAWERIGDGESTRVEAYVLQYRMQLFSNFTYFLEDPVHGDQFLQEDRRTVAGFRATQRWSGSLGGHLTDTEVGLQVRNDNISNLALRRTQARRVLSTTLDDQVVQTSGALYLQTKTQWSDRFRTIVGLRGDRYWFDVRSDTPENSGRSQSGLLSPKVGVVFGPWHDTEIYASAGYGFHSNDARGAVIRVDPTTGSPAERVTPIVRTKGYEIGLRSTTLPAWQTTLALWKLDIGSELVFSGDAGSTEPSRPSRRWGIEWANEVELAPWASLNADLAYSWARFADWAPGGDRIPGSIEGVGILGLSIKPSASVQVGLNYRYFGPRTLIEDNSVRSKASNLVQAEVRWQARPWLTLTASVFNALDAKATDIDYYYPSRLPGEPAAGVQDIHTHPVEPRQIRFGIQVRF